MWGNAYYKEYMFRRKMNQVFWMYYVSQFLNVKIKSTLTEQFLPWTNLLLIFHLCHSCFEKNGEGS